MKEEETGNCHHWVANEHFQTKLTVPLAPCKGTKKSWLGSNASHCT